MSKITPHKVLREVERYKRTDRIVAMQYRQKEYRDLVDKFGTDLVAMASGLTITTLRQYLRTKNPNIGYEPLAQAKAVFIKLS